MSEKAFPLADADLTIALLDLVQQVSLFSLGVESLNKINKFSINDLICFFFFCKKIQSRDDDETGNKLQANQKGGQ